LGLFRLPLGRTSGSVLVPASVGPGTGTGTVAGTGGTATVGAGTGGTVIVGTGGIAVIGAGSTAAGVVVVIC
jgi:hypothetical protein